MDNKYKVEDSIEEMKEMTEEMKEMTEEIRNIEKERSMADLKFVTTDRGFQVVNFTDYYSQKCSLQESSVVPHIWLGVDVDLKGNEVNKRMHLSIEQVEALIPLLQHFVYYGKLPDETCPHT